MDKNKKEANCSKDGVETTIWVENWFRSCSLMFCIEFLSNYKLQTKIMILSELSLINKNCVVIVMI